MAWYWTYVLILADFLYLACRARLKKPFRLFLMNERYQAGARELASMHRTGIMQKAALQFEVPKSTLTLVRQYRSALDVSLQGFNAGVNGGEVRLW